jgi:DNA polymerase III subunit gamma/tau
MVLWAMRSIVTPFVKRYRPKIFEDVVGQDEPVRYLSGLISNGRACRNIGLHGSIGSGKTTLAYIYANGLNCESPAASGSPCLQCPSCDAFENGSEPGFFEFDTPQFSKPDELKHRVNQILSSKKRAGKRLVIFIDEAHALSNYKDSADFLLKTVEDTPADTCFCFATTAFERLSAALRSRLFALRLRPLPLERSVQYLSEIARKERIDFEPEALSLLAGLGEGQPRNMLQALDQVSDDGRAERARVTRDSVIAMFGISGTDVLCKYFVALGRGDFAQQSKLFFEWNEPVREKARLVQLLLVAMYYNDIQKAEVFIDPLISSIRTSDREKVLSAFRDRIGASSLKDFWADMMSMWSVVTRDMSEEGLLSLIVRFQQTASRMRPAPRPESSPHRLPDLPAGAVQARVKRSRSGTSIPRALRIQRAERDPNYLTIKDVQSLINSASFLVQEHGSQFNTRITIRHGMFGCKTQAEASEHFAAFSKALNDRLLHWTGYGHRLGVQEIDEKDEFCGRMIAAIPPRDAVTAERWLKMWGRKERADPHEGAAICFKISALEPLLNTHWRCVRWLCGGVNPKEPLLEHLRIEPEYMRIAGDIGTRTRLSIPNSLSSSAIREVEKEHGLGVLSAFDDQAWGHLYSGWELEEHLSRMKHKRLRTNSLDEVRIRLRPDSSPEATAVFEAAEADLRRAWAGTYERDRAWTLWTARERGRDE